MFTIKVTYRGQIRKHTFSDTNSFPPYEDICSQLNRAFSLSRSFYLSKLLFSPDAAQPSRILISKEVRNAHDYHKCIRQFKNRTWVHALLRFSVIDSPSYAPEINVPLGMSMGTEASWPLPQSIPNRHSVSALRLPVAFSTTYSSSSQAPMDVDAPPQMTRSVSLNGSRPQLNFSAAQRRHVSTTGSCCSVSQGNAEMRAILAEFKEVVDGALATNSTMTSNRVDEAPPPSLCSVCTRSIGTYREGRGDWYSCDNCHVVVCDTCHKEERPGFCLSSMGSHNMKLATSSRVLPIPHLPTPWALRGESASTNTPRANLPEVRETGERDQQPSQAAVSPPPVVHIGVRCDVCNVNIEGVRHKCLDCPDYDLCSACINNGAAGAHNPFHEFFEITEPGRVVVHTVFSGEGERETRRALSRDHAQESSPAEIHLATCDLCDSRIIGDRYKCAACPDFDACGSCFSITPEQHPHHSFVRIRKREDYVGALVPTRAAHFATCDGCHKTIYGFRFKCMHPDCPDYDLCQNCEAIPIPVHPANHPMLKMKSPETVIPTVYRVGQTEVIPQEQAANRLNIATAAPTVVEPQVIGRPTSPISFRPIVVQEDQARTTTPTPRVALATLAPAASSPVRPLSPVKPPPVPPKPEMMSHPSWASIPGFFGSSAHWEPEPHNYNRYPTVYENHGENYKVSLKNPFADISLPDTPTTFGAVEQAAPNLQPVVAADISLPTVPSHTPTNPWPTTNPADRQELLQLIADFSGPSTSPKIIRSLADNYSPPKGDESVASSQHTPLEPIAASAKSAIPPPPPPKVEENKQSIGDFSEFSMARLLQGLEERVASLKVAVEPKNTSISETSSLSNEALLRHPAEQVASSSSTLSYHPYLAHLISELPSLVPRTLKTPEEGDQPEARIPLSAGFIEDVTVPDGQAFPPGAEFMKCWRLVNDSAKEWPESTELVFVAGESLMGDVVPLPVEVGKVAAGAEIDVWTGELKAPEALGRYVSYWRLKADGEVFGNSLWIEINVVESDSHHSSDESMAASSIIMPTASSSEASKRDPSTTVQSAISITSTEEEMSDTASDISLVSMPSSPSDDEDEALWHDSRSFTTAEQAAASARAASATGTPATNTSAMDYVLLYDDNSSESD